MPPSLYLSTSARSFWSTIAGAAFSNPFSGERVAFDERIVGQRIDPFAEDHLDQLSAAISVQVEELESTGGADWRRYGAKDQEILQVGFLFEVFHRWWRHLDNLVMSQIEAGERPLKVAFGEALLADLHRRGFGQEESTHYLAVFYQLRRAYHFIVRGLVGHAPCMREFRRHLWNNIFTQDIGWYHRLFWDRMEDFSTLLLGETGAGKGAAAAAVGRSGFIPYDAPQQCFAESFTRGFISLNLSQFPESLIESELFGHRKGAFTGAVDRHQGLLSRCSPHGAIFLDEIGDVSVPVQIKLLQVLQDRVYTPVGSHESLRFRGRVIAATNRSLSALRSQGLFRDDFYYRLCSDVIRVPPLRDRIAEDPEELPRLLRHVVIRLCGREEPELVDVVSDALAKQVPPNYEWPGNVRELEQAARQILLTRQYSVRSTEPPKGWRDAWWARAQAGQLDADALLAGYCRLLYETEATYEGVARRTGLDRRTARKYVHQGQLLTVAASGHIQ